MKQNETETRIVAWLRQPVNAESVGEYWLRAKMAFYWIFRPTTAMQIGLTVAADLIESDFHKNNNTM